MRKNLLKRVALSLPSVILLYFSAFSQAPITITGNVRHSVTQDRVPAVSVTTISVRRPRLSGRTPWRRKRSSTVRESAVSAPFTETLAGRVAMLYNHSSAYLNNLYPYGAPAGLAEYVTDKENAQKSLQ